MKKVQFLLPLACLMFTTGVAQGPNPKVDSLLRVLQADAPDDKVEVLWGIAYELADVDNSEALFFATRAYQEVWKHGDSLQIVKVGTTYGQLLRRMDQVDQSITVSSRLLAISRRHDFRKYTKMLLNSLALAYTFNEELDKALELHLESLYLRRSEGNPKEELVSLHNIGIIYLRLGDPGLALEYCLKSMDLVTKTNEIYVLDNLLADVGSCYVELKQYETGLKYLNLALQESKAKANLIGVLTSEFAIGYTLIQVKNYVDAKPHLSRSLELAIKTGSQRYQISSFLYLSEISMSENNFLTCERYLDRADSTPAINEYAQLRMDSYKRRSSLHLALNEYKDAALFLNKYVALKDEVYNSEMTNKLRRIQAIHNEEENVARIKSQARMLDMSEEIISNQYWLIALCILVVLLSSIVASLLFMANRRKSRINSMLDARVRERTLELGLHRDTLQHTVDELAISRQRLAEEVIGLTATMKGLLYVGGKEVASEHSMFIQQAELTNEKIVKAIGNYRSNGKLVR